MRFFRLRLLASLLVGIILIAGATTYFDVLAHRHTMRIDLARQTQWFGAGAQSRIEQDLNSGAQPDWPGTLKKLRNQPDQPRLTIFDSSGQLLATEGDSPPASELPFNLVSKTLNSGKEAGAFVKIRTFASGSTVADSRLWYEDAVPLHAGGKTAGVLLMMVDADSIRSEGISLWRRSFFQIVAMVVLIVVVTLLMVRWFVHEPVTQVALWLRRLRRGEADVDEATARFGALVPLANEVASLVDSLTQARVEAETEARLRDHGETVWTANRLAVNARDRMGAGKLFVVSNREPYMHVRDGGKTECVVPPSGLVTALEPVLQACDGVWIAHGSGNDDRAFVDAHDRLAVPPNDPRYTLRRVWLNEAEEAGYYEGFSNEGLWPLCHIAHTRPIFRSSDWARYQDVNRRFCDILLEEMQGCEHPVVLVQDYHFALLPRMVKNARPDARISIFWHIPWPNAEAFGICPWQAELLDGLLGADIIGFHLQSHCNNFLDTVDRVLEARTDWEQFSILRNDHVSLVRPYPISVAWTESNSKLGSEGASSDVIGTQNKVQAMATIPAGVEGSARESDPTASALHRELGIEGKQLLLGVDRLDYTKGIVERLLAIEHLLEESPAYLEKIVFVQIASPSRTRIPSYVSLRLQVEQAVERINSLYQTARWKPVILIERNCSHEEVLRYYRAATLCIVNPLHDGMNLVAKEYLAARTDGDGMLILSKFAGAAQELRDALVVNPYDIEQVSEAIRTGLQMSREERRLRMGRMRQQVKEHNVYRWASTLLTDLCAVRIEEEVLSGSRTESLRETA